MEEFTTSDLDMMSWAAYYDFQILRTEWLDNKLEITYSVPNKLTFTSSFMMDKTLNCNALKMCKAIKEAKDRINQFKSIKTSA